MGISYQPTWKLEDLISKALVFEVYDIKISLTNKGGQVRVTKQGEEENLLSSIERSNLRDEAQHH